VAAREAVPQGLLRASSELDDHFDVERLLFSEHHLSHAASAFFASPFERAAVLTMDGVGEWATTSFAVGDGAHLEIRKEIHFPHSLGLLYSAFTYYTGFKVNSGEYKVMGWRLTGGRSMRTEFSSTSSTSSGMARSGSTCRTSTTAPASR
jgi:predicted NodU family carbamoyl transferase